MRRHAAGTIVALLAVAVLAGGCGKPLFDYSDTLLSQAGDAGWTKHVQPQTTFTTFALASPGLAAAQTVHVYIESDGFAWARRDKPADSPKPYNPMALRLALADPAAGVIYLARPCQWVDGVAWRNCDPVYWTSARFAPKVIEDLDDAITDLLALPGSAQHRSRNLVLFGFSGGGAVAALIAARRADISALVTMAAPLDHTAWTGWHKVSPLTESLNPADLELSAFPEIHLAGGKDTIVPAHLIQEFAAARPGARVQVMPAFTHSCCWAETWPEILTALNLPR